MTDHPDHQINTRAKTADRRENEAGLPMPGRMGLTLDESARSSDGLLLHVGMECSRYAAEIA